MNFKLTEEQRMWRKAVHDFCDQEVKPRAAEVLPHDLKSPLTNVPLTFRETLLT